MEHKVPPKLRLSESNSIEADNGYGFYYEIIESVNYGNSYIPPEIVKRYNHHAALVKALEDVINGSQSVESRYQHMRKAEELLHQINAQQ